MFWKLALQEYIRKPQDFEEVVYWDDKAVIVKDRFPKASFHLLVLPRDRQLTNKLPTVALTKEVKLQLEPYLTRAKEYIFEQFIENYSALDGNSLFASEEELRDRDTFSQKFVQVGIHSVPSMNNLHIHVITRDFNSPRLKNKKHYLSFTTEFFVPWLMLPLNQVPNKRESEQLLKNQDMACVYCHENYKNRFQDLKMHLKHEFETHFAERCTNI